MAPELKVTLEKLREEAKYWESNADICAGVGAAGDGLRLSGLEAGIFFIIFQTHNRICDLVATECARGSSYMHDAAAALRSNANIYERSELEASQSIRDLGNNLPGY